MKKMLLLFLMSVVIMSNFFGKTLLQADAKESSQTAYQRYYAGIEVGRGDSLWSIAETYRANSGMTSKEYVRELKKMNRLTSDRILAGDSLTVVYFSDEIK